MPRHIQKSNAGKSVIRSRVEHVFADQKSQIGLFVQTVGIVRTTMRTRLANIVYNICRFSSWSGLTPPPLLKIQSKHQVQEAAITGHKTLTAVKLYTHAVKQKPLVQAAITKIS